MSLKDNLPNFISGEKYTKEILEAINPEIDKIKLDLSKIILECCVTTCTEEGAKRYEKDYAIQYSPQFSLDERKKQIINKMLSKRRLTKTELINFIRRNIDGAQFYIMNEAQKYEFSVYLIDKKYREKLYQAIFEARPAHLLFKIEITSYERRCGTFNSKGDIHELF